MLDRQLAAGVARTSIAYKDGLDLQLDGTNTWTDHAPLHVAILYRLWSSPPPCKTTRWDAESLETLRRSDVVAELGEAIEDWSTKQTSQAAYEVAADHHNIDAMF